MSYNLKIRNFLKLPREEQAKGCDVVCCAIASKNEATPENLKRIGVDVRKNHDTSLFSYYNTTSLGGLALFSLKSTDPAVREYCEQGLKLYEEWFKKNCE